MKLDPIKNPHSKTGKVEKKTKEQEKDELIDKTKKQVIDKYGVSQHHRLNAERVCIEKIS